MKKLLFIALISSLMLCGCSESSGEKQEANTVVAEEESTVVQDEYSGDTGINMDTSEAVEDPSEVDIEDSAITETELSMDIDGIPFVLGSTLKDVTDDFDSINYRLDANIENRNLSPEEEFEIPIIGDGDRTVGYMTIVNKNASTSEMADGTVSEITINPTQVLSIDAYGVTADATIEETRELLGDPDEETGTSMVYAAPTGSVNFMFKSSGILDGICIREVVK